MMRRLFQRWRNDAEGVTAVEFALVAPVLLIGMMGVFDMGHNMYTASVLNGSIQKVARDSTIEGAASNESALDSRVQDLIDNIAPGAKATFKRTAYTSFSDVKEPEDFTDVNGDGTCNDGEPFEDANGNGTWDADRGSAGFGSARDAVLYEVTVNYPRLFPVSKILGTPDTMQMTVKTVLRNQPFGEQQARTMTDNCA